MDDESGSSTPLYMKMLLASLVYVVSSAAVQAVRKKWKKDGVFGGMCVCVRVVGCRLLIAAYA